MQAIQAGLQANAQRGFRNGQEKDAKRECSKPSGDDRPTSLGSKGKTPLGTNLLITLGRREVSLWDPSEVYCFKPTFVLGYRQCVIGTSSHPGFTEEPQGAACCRKWYLRNGCSRAVVVGKTRGAEIFAPHWQSRGRLTAPSRTRIGLQDPRREPLSTAWTELIKKETPSPRFFPPQELESEQNCHRLTACVAAILINDSGVRPGKRIV
jgi:hypothetical protein